MSRSGDNTVNERENSTTSTEQILNELDTTIEEWREELQKHKNIPGYTISELAAEIGVCRETMRKRLNKLTKEGKCIRATGIRHDELGGIYSVPVYTLVKKGKK
jgi:DNA-binding GntR family transcriptional regulator